MAACSSDQIVTLGTGSIRKPYFPLMPNECEYDPSSGVTMRQLLCSLSVVFCVACGLGGCHRSEVSKSDQDTDTLGADTDADTDMDADADSDIDSDTDTDADGDTDTDADGDTDTDTDIDSDADTDGDSDTDSDADTMYTCPFECATPALCSAVSGIVHKFDVVEKQVDIRPDLVQSFPGGVTTGVERCVDFSFPAGTQQIQEEARLGQRFSPRKGGASSRLIVEGNILFDLRYHLGGCHLLAHDLPGFGPPQRDLVVQHLQFDRVFQQSLPQHAPGSAANESHVQ